MQIKAVIFDLGGVLVRTEDKRPRTELAMRYGLTYEQIDNLVFNGEIAARAEVGELDGSEVWSGVCRRLQIPLDQAEWFEEQFWAGDRLDVQLVDFIRALRPRYKTALLSNAWSRLREFLIERYKIIDAFDQVVISAEVGLAKPDPRIYALVVERLGVEPEEAVFVDDVPENVEAARAAGLHGVRFVRTEQVIEEVGRLLKAT